MTRTGGGNPARLVFQRPVNWTAKPLLRIFVSMKRFITLTLSGLSAIADGMARIWVSVPFDLNPKFAPRRYPRSPYEAWKADADAISSDWKNVGDDIRKGIERR